MQAVAAQGGNIFRKAHALVWQQRDECILPALIVFCKADGRFVFQVNMLRAVQKSGGLLCSVLFYKDTVRDLLFLIRLLPGCLKGKRVDKIHCGVVRNGIDNFRDHPVCLFPDPGIDAFAGCVIERRFVNACAVIIGIGLQKAFVDRGAAVCSQPNGVCKVQLRPLPLRKMRLPAEQIRIERFFFHAEHGFRLRERFALRAVCGHSEGAQHGKGREQQSFTILYGVLKQAHRKIDGGSVFGIGEGGSIGGTPLDALR